MSFSVSVSGAGCMTQSEMDALSEHVRTFCRRLSTDGFDPTYAQVSGPGPSPAMSWLLAADEAGSAAALPPAEPSAPEAAPAAEPARYVPQVDTHHPNEVGPPAAYPAG